MTSRQTSPHYRIRQESAKGAINGLEAHSAGCTVQQHSAKSGQTLTINTIETNIILEAPQSNVKRSYESGRRQQQ
jgi:hypothetical protein